MTELTTKEFIGVFLGVCCMLFAVGMSIKAAQEVRKRQYDDAIEDMRNSGLASIFTFLCMFGALINLSEMTDAIQRKSNSALRKKSSELSELRGQLDPQQDRWVAVDK